MSADELTKEELKELHRVFSPCDVCVILDRFSVDEIRKVIGHPTFEK